MFYETTKGFHLRTFDGLCEEPIVMTFRENVPDRTQGTVVMQNLQFRNLSIFEVIPNKILLII